ncbi:MAG: enoyl-CoA hydratase/isomerase family protein [Candidatus Bathyarchaeum sp.]|nr:MAG: enoyl-CoA hydratase/isomerase family protein [Candidatus Bathyarchaeum sp.]
MSPVSKSYKTIKLTKEQTTTWITLNRPNKLNAINATMLEELSEALDTIEKDSESRCVIIIGEGKRAFSTGADITELQKLTQETASKFSRKGQKVFNKVEALSKPVIAAINGYALGGGLELALACDFRLASEHAELGFPEMKLGIIPGWGGSQRLPWTVGAAEAKRLIMLGNRVKADEALRMGLVDKVVPQNTLEAEAEALAQRLLESLPTALKNAKHAINSVTQRSLEAGLKKERDLFVLLFSTKETRERIDSFVSKRNRKVGNRKLD